MFSKKFDDCNVLLASRSKRRHELLKQMGVKFKIIDQSIDESFPNSLKENNITEYLAKKKSIPIVNKLKKKRWANFNSYQNKKRKRLFFCRGGKR